MAVEVTFWYGVATTICGLLIIAVLYFIFRLFFGGRQQQQQQQQQQQTVVLQTGDAMPTIGHSDQNDEPESES